jgi:hypothetical protein
MPSARWTGIALSEGDARIPAVQCVRDDAFHRSSGGRRKPDFELLSLDWAIRGGRRSAPRWSEYFWASRWPAQRGLTRYALLVGMGDGCGGGYAGLSRARSGVRMSRASASDSDGGFSDW